MIIHPAVISLSVGSILVSIMLLIASAFGISILRHWNIRSGSELQLILERKTYLISTLMTYALWFQLASFFLFIFTADHLHRLFVGAMCAAGTLNVNEYGYPALVMKMITFVLAGIWIIVNYSDNRAYDYPLVKKKYGMLLVLTPFVFSETLLQGFYFAGMRADVITSCCGSIFGTGENTVSSELASLPSVPLKIAFYAGLAFTFIAGIFSLKRKGKGGMLFSLVAVSMFLISLASLISFLSSYIYELPTHHCPFCMLQSEFSYIGYVFYLSLFCGTVTGAGAGVLAPFRKIESLSDILPGIQKKLILAAIVSFLIFGVAATYVMLASPLILEGH